MYNEIMKYSFVLITFLLLVVYYTSAASAQCVTQNTDPRVKSGLITTPELPGTNNKFGNNSTGACITSSDTSFVSYKIPTYEDLKSKYYTQAKNTSTVQKVDSPASLPISLTDKDRLYHFTGDLTISSPANITGTQTGVVFVEGNLNIEKDINGGSNGGLVFVVGKDVNINQTVGQIDAVLISSGTIYTAGAGCNTNSVTTEALTINGSLISINPSNGSHINFCRQLADNRTAAEIINNDPKYLVILRNLLSDTVQRWSEI